MKQSHIKFAFLLIFMSSSLIFAQDVEGPISYLSENLGSIRTKKSEFSQSFGMQEGEDEACMLWYQKTPIGKGEQEKFSFNAADLNENRIQFDTRRDLVIIKAAVKGKKDLIRTYEDGEVSGYTDEVEMYASSVEDARKLVEELKTLANSCAARMEKQLALREDASKTELLEYLKENISKVEVNDERFGQEFDASPENSSIVTYTQHEVNEDQLREYKVNVLDFNLARIGFDTEKEFVLVKIETKAKRNLIQLRENGELKNYDNNLEIYVPSIEKARNISKILKDLVRAAEKEDKEKSTLRSDTDPASAIEYLEAEVQEVVINEDIYKQSFEADAEFPYLVSFTVQEGGEDEEELYKLNLSDLDPSSVDFDVKRNAVFVSAECASNKRYIQKEENKAITGFGKDLEIRVKDIETARAIQKRLYHAVKNYRENRSNNFTLNNPDADRSDAIAFCEDEIQKVGSGEDVFEQAYKVGEEGDCLAEIEIEDIDKGETTAYLFNWSDINPSKISFETRSKEVFIEVETKGKKELIQVVENGEVDDYERDFSIRCKDIESARALVAAMKVLAKDCSDE